MLYFIKYVLGDRVRHYYSSNTIHLTHYSPVVDNTLGHHTHLISQLINSWECQNIWNTLICRRQIRCRPLTSDPDVSSQCRPVWARSTHPALPAAMAGLWHSRRRALRLAYQLYTVQCASSMLSADMPVRCKYVLGFVLAVAIPGNLYLVFTYMDLNLSPVTSTLQIPGK